DILPPAAGDLPPAEAVRRLFADLDVTLAARIEAGDVLVGGQEVGGGPGGAVRALRASVDVALAARIEAGDVLVAGQQLGAGPGGAVAARALRAAGMLAVVAATYADGFDRALLDAGVAALAGDAPALFHTGQRLRLNIEGGTIANL